MRVEGITTNFNEIRQHVYYVGTHLVNYDPTALKNRAKVKTSVENGIFKRFLEKPNGQLDLMSASTTREKKFLEKRNEFNVREELLQRLNYVTGVHYSLANQIKSISND